MSNSLVPIRAGIQTDWDEMIVSIPVISNSPRYATPVGKQPRLENPRRFWLKIPMILRESEPGNIFDYLFSFLILEFHNTLLF